MRWHSQPGEKGKGKLGRKPGQKGKGKGIRDPAEAGGSVATKGEAAKAAGRKGPTNGVTEGSSGSCRRHAQREKKPGQRLMAVYPQKSRTLETQRNNQGKIGGNTRWKQQTNKREKERRKLPKSSYRTVSCHAWRIRRVRRERKGQKGKEASSPKVGVQTNGVWSRSADTPG